MQTKIKIIKWLDSSLENTQVWSGDYPEPQIIESVGFVVEETKGWITLARDKMHGGSFRGLVSIPKNAILDKG